jgi:hypothetical protein
MNLNLQSVDTDTYLKAEVAHLLGSLMTADARKAHSILRAALDKAYSDGFQDGSTSQEE